MRIQVWLSALFLWCLAANASGQPAEKYFQQQVTYNIYVKLDDVHHVLRGDMHISYQNNSPDTLRYVYFNLYPNAYRNNFTPFAQQYLENGKTDFYFAPDSDRGSIDSLRFEVNSIITYASRAEAGAGMLQVFLPVPLPPGRKVYFYTPFRVKLPRTFSRMGHEGQQYQISQWYPKPAVYDRYGWHLFPYLDQGEFYGEFGSYQVHITLPENYVVAATGTLQTAREVKWLDAKADSSAIIIKQTQSAGWKQLKEEGKVFPPSSREMKTIYYKADSVHDFAWFADKRYVVEKSSVTLPHSKRTVDTWSFYLPFHNLWYGSSKFIDSAVYYYSKWVGDYPYPQASAVDGALSAGGGMEYPMVTVIGISGTIEKVNGGAMGQAQSGLDDVIAHEVGHNWFYSALGFNEREHPWMDEGINSYYENRYMEARYPGHGLLALHGNGAARFFHLDRPRHDQNYLFYLYQARQHRDQPCDMNAADFTMMNYGAIVYAKTAEVFRYLENELGTAEFDSVMQDFYSEWQFKHPYPDDLRKFFEAQTGKDLDWCFNKLLGTNDALDYRLVKQDVGMKIGEQDFVQLRIKNAGDVDGPFSIAAFKDGNKVDEKQYEGFSGRADERFPSGDYDYFKIDPEEVLPEVNRSNNYLRSHGIMKTLEPLRFQPIASLDDGDHTQVFFTPLTGWNKYDGFTPGVALYNSVFFPKKVNAVLLPQVGLHSGKFVGLAAADMPFYFRQGWLHAITLSSTARTYSYGNSTNFGDTAGKDLRYYRLKQTLNLELRNKEPRSSISRNLTISNTWVGTEAIYSYSDGKKYSHLMSNRIIYSVTDSRVLNPYRVYGCIEQGILHDNGFAKIYAGGDFTLTYPKKHTGLNIRAFAGIVLAGNLQTNLQLAATQGDDDYRFDEIFPGRSETGGLLSKQIAMNDDGGFKIRTLGLQPEWGSTRNWLLAVNLKVPLPVFTPLFAFVDAGFAPNDVYDVFQYDAGVGITVIPGILTVYLPTFFSEDIQYNLNTMPLYEKWYQRISFELNIDKLNPLALARNIRL